jgi:hypothetical protein
LFTLNDALFAVNDFVNVAWRHVHAMFGADSALVAHALGAPSSVANAARVVATVLVGELGVARGLAVVAVRAATAVADVRVAVARVHGEQCAAHVDGVSRVQRSQSMSALHEFSSALSLTRSNDSKCNATCHVIVGIATKQHSAKIINFSCIAESGFFCRSWYGSVDVSYALFDSFDLASLKCLKHLATTRSTWPATRSFNLTD